jgi:hypothetical protein
MVIMTISIIPHSSIFSVALCDLRTSKSVYTVYLPDVSMDVKTAPLNLRKKRKWNGYEHEVLRIFEFKKEEVTERWKKCTMGSFKICLSLSYTVQG